MTLKHMMARRRVLASGAGALVAGIVSRPAVALALPGQNINAAEPARPLEASMTNIITRRRLLQGSAAGIGAAARRHP